MKENKLIKDLVTKIGNSIKNKTKNEPKNKSKSLNNRRKKNVRFGKSHRWR